MEVPKRILVDVKDDNQPKNHVPAGYYSESDYDYNSDLDDTPTREKVEPTTRLMSPPEKLTIPEINDEERGRYIRESL